jgi:hypothetical protein
MTRPFAIVALIAAFALAAIQCPTAQARSTKRQPAATAGPQPGPAAPAADPNAQDTSLSGPGPLVANGFGSPACRVPQQRAHLSTVARFNCAASGFTAAPAPLDHYQFDIHIDTGLLGLNLDTIVQDLILTPVWTAVLWLVHICLAALEWCYSIDLLSSGTLAPVARGLDAMSHALTQPWLAAVLAIAAVAVVYHGVVRRRVAETLGQCALMLAMMALGLWVIADPADTVGWASRLANDSSLGTLSAASAGDPSQPVRTFDDGLRAVFDSAITGPWCYLEFGQVDWCRSPGRLDPRIVAAARRIAAIDRAGVGRLQSDCAGPAPPSTQCAPRGSPAQRDLLRSADLLDRARTNGELFLALAANGPQRNSINADSANPSLLRVICGTADATSCTAATGPQAEFRTQKGTWARAGGLLLIVIGTAGMLALLGFLGLRLLAAALMALFYLLLAPVAVLAPALGDGGRAAFRVWVTRLLGAVLAKLVYSLFLGVALLMLTILDGLEVLGWWTQWLLIASFWWILFHNRHRLLEPVIQERRTGHRGGLIGGGLLAARQAARFGRPVARAAGRVAHAGFDRARSVPEFPRRTGAAPKPRPEAGKWLADQVSRTLEVDRATDASPLAAAAVVAARRERHERLVRERSNAASAGDRRREVSLGLRAERLKAELAAAELELTDARRTAADRPRSIGHDRRLRADRSALLDRAAATRPMRARPDDPRGGRRDYARLATLAGLTPRQYERSSAPERRLARIEIDRELERRVAWTTQAGELRASRPSAGFGKRSPQRPSPTPISRRQRQFSRHIGRP